MSNYEDLDTLFAEMDTAAASARAKAAMDGSLSAEYRAIRSLDPQTIQDITPDTTDEAAYEELMAVVQQASARNESQAQLAGRIKEMGAVAVEIAKRVPTLCKIIS